MCDIDDDGMARAWTETWRTARKRHRCCACDEDIRPGDRYHFASGIFEDGPATFKHCARCWSMYETLQAKFRQERRFGEGVVITLDCGEEWEGPPDDVAALAFITPDEAQEAVRVAEGRRRAP